MRFLYFLTIVFILGSCEKNETLDILPDVYVNQMIDLNLPQYIDLQIPSGWAYSGGGIRGIIIQNTGIGNPHYKAFDRACPTNDCSSGMEFDGSLRLTCPCDKSTYSILDGSPQTVGFSHFAREYKVIVLGNSTLNITNF